MPLYLEFPSWLDPYVVSFLPIRWYAVMYVVAFAIAYALYAYQFGQDKGGDIDAAIRLRDLFTPTVRSVNASLETMKTQMAAAKQSVSGLSDKLTEHERIQKRTAKSIEQTGSKISGLSDKMALLSAPILAAATAGFKLHSDFANGIAKISTLVDTTVVSMQKVSDEIRAVSDETGAGVADHRRERASGPSQGLCRGAWTAQCGL